MFSFLKLSLLIVLSLLSLVSFAQLKQFTPGELWPDNKGVHINAHGGGLLYFQGKYYWYGEFKSENTSSALVGITCYSSTDLLNWTNEGVVLPVSNDEQSDIAKGCIMERPKVVYNANTKKFVLWFHLEIKDQGYKVARVALAVSDSPTGVFEYKRSYRPNAGIYPINFTDAQKQTTINIDSLPKGKSNAKFEAVVAGAYLKRDLQGGQMSRDMTIFVDDNGKAYHIYASEENQTLQIAELSDDYQSHNGRYVRILEGKHNEAPSIFKRKGKYYMITSGCTGWDPNAARMAVADSLFGTWTELGNPCVGTDAHLTFKSQSTYIQKVEGKKDLYIFMADRWTPKNPIDARYIWLPILFENEIPVLKWHDKWNI